MWQASFAIKPPVLEDIKRMLVLDERILRHIFTKKELFGALPTTHRVTKMAKQKLKR